MYRFVLASRKALRCSYHQDRAVQRCITRDGQMEDNSRASRQSTKTQDEGSQLPKRMDKSSWIKAIF